MTCVVTATGALLNSKDFTVRMIFLTLLAILLSMPIISTLSIFDGKQRHQVLENNALLKQPLSPITNVLHNSLLMDSDLIEPKTGDMQQQAQQQHMMSMKVQDKTTLEMMKEVKCWLLLWCTFSVIGGGILITVNMGQMADAVGGGDGAASTAVTLFAVSQVKPDF
jgi:hypothetical protein